jgi:hypothetical protein
MGSPLKGKDFIPSSSFQLLHAVDTAMPRKYVLVSLSSLLPARMSATQESNVDFFTALF